MTHQATPERIALALAACEGLSDAELADRGPAGYRKMRDRKRAYAAAARKLAVACATLIGRMKAMEKAAAEIEALDDHVDDTSQAAAMLDAMMKGGKAAD